MKQYPSYKESTVEWLGKVPDGWAVKRVKWLCNVKRGQSPRPIDDSSYFDENGEYAWVRISDVTASDKYLYQTEQKLSELGASKSVKLEPDELFVSIAATVGKPIINKIKCCIHDGFVWLEGLEQSKDFFYFVFSGGELYKGLGKIGTQLNLNSEYIANIYVPVPPMDEQKIIVKYLERKTAQIDTLIEKKQRQIDLLQEQRTALINHAVTKGLNRNVHMKDSGVEWLGKIPSHWRSVKAKQVSKIFVPQRNKPELNQDGDGLPWITTEDLTSASIGKSNKNYYVSRAAAKESGSKSLPAGSVIASCVGRFGVSSVSECELIINQQLQAYIPHSINPWFLHYYIIISKHYFERVATSSTLPYVNQENFGMLPVTLPPLEEQEKIVQHIEKSNLLADKTIGNYQKQIEYLQEYRTALISEAVTGKIDVRTAV